MKIAVFGATGGIGKFVVKHALEKGYEVNAYVRNPQKLQIENKNLKVFVGQVSDYDKIKETIAGCDDVIIALGISMKFGYDKASFATIVPGILASIFLPKAKKVLKQVHSIVVNSDLDWTIVRFMAPKNTLFTKEVKESFGDVKKIQRGHLKIKFEMAPF